MKSVLTFFSIILFSLNIIKGQECETSFTSDFLFTNFCSEDDYYNDEDIINTIQSSTNDYRVFYRTNETVNTNCDTGLDIKRPIIIVEGFDIDNTIDPIDIYNLYINLHDAGDDLRDLGYDIITFDWASPLNPIEVNARILSNFIQYINSEKDSNEELIILGVSMGGLITKLALTEMEENNISHQTKLFLSFDTPHRGANIPISMQDFSFELFDMWFVFSVMGIEAPDEFFELYMSLKSPSALEMTRAAFDKTVDGYLYPAPCFIDFHSYLRNLNDCNGYPKNSKNVAISNGSYNGDLQTGLDALGNVSGNPAIRISDSYNFYVRTLNTVPGSDNPSVSDVCVVNRYSYCDIGHTNVLNYGPPIEHAPGGFYNWYGVVMHAINSSINDFSVDFIHTERATFIPIISALDLFTSNQLINLSSFGKNTVLNCSPFDDIYWNTITNNTEHTDLTHDISDFIFNQITNYSITDN